MAAAVLAVIDLLCAARENTTMKLRTFIAVMFGLACVRGALAGDLAFGDPERLPHPPAGALGYPSRAADLDALPGFVNPPHGYGEVAFYWWLGDPLTKERLTWQLDKLAGKGIVGLQINYAHSDKGGQSFGLTYPSDPPLFSDAWWKLVQWFAAEAKKRGMAISLSDYTLGIVGQGWWMDEILREQPDLNGSTVQLATFEAPGGKEFLKEVSESTIGATAFRVDANAIVPGSGVDLRPQVQGNTLRWQAPSGKWRVVLASTRLAPRSVDPLDPRLGPEVIKHFFQRFEDHLPGEAGKALNCFFSDELSFGISGNLWHKQLAAEFKKSKGYDLVPELAALGMDIGPRTPKVRLDYLDVMVRMQEKAYFEPLFQWHYKRGMLYGCDHGGRGGNVVEFGDYFRTQRWMLGPGNDQPGLGRTVSRTKVQSSISHLYQRPRTWLEGYYGSGWGTTLDALTAASAENYALGSTLQALHGLYYTTHGGYWEWAPPCNHFRMPYWEHMGTWMTWSQRLCYIMSQGVHRCDVALLYPVSPSQAGMDGKEASTTAFSAADQLFKSGIDLDFMDDESLARATVKDKELQISGEKYRALVLPAMSAIRWSTLQKAAEFKRAGGTVIALGALPVASDRAGREDPELNALVKELFPAFAKTSTEVEETVTQAFARDFMGTARVNHRKIGARDFFLVCGAQKDAECAFRAKGKAELWDPWTGTQKPLTVVEQKGEITKLRMPLTEKEAQLIVFSPGSSPVGTEAAAPAVNTIEMSGDWEFELKPTMDNRFGDFRWPPTPNVIGAEARQIRYAAEAVTNPGWQEAKLDDSKWSKVTAGFGPMFWKLGPLPKTADVATLEAKLTGLTQVDPAKAVEIDGKQYRWKPYAFSWRLGLEGDPGHQGYHGLKENVSDEFICLGAPKRSMREITYGDEPAGTRYYLWTAAVAKSDSRVFVRATGNCPAAAWINHARISQSAALKAGANPLLLRYDKPGRGAFVLDATGSSELMPDQSIVPTTTTAGIVQPVFCSSPLTMTWHDKAGIVPFDAYPDVAHPAGWYRFTSLPGLRALTFTAHGKVRVWADGKELKLSAMQSPNQWRASVAAPSAAPVKVAIRIEHERGLYGGAALPDPITLEAAPGTIAIGDWSQIDGLASYSGGAWYRKSVPLTASQATGSVTLDLGTVVASAEVRVNGKPADLRVAAPWRFDIGKFVKPGENRIEVLVYNTLANHYSTIPTHYRGSPVSGILGPVKIEIQ